MSLMWRCNICDLTMQVISRSSHLAGRRHAAKAASTGPAEWKCTVCRRTMDKNSKQPHLSGKAHAKMMKASRISAESGTVPEQPKYALHFMERLHITYSDSISREPPRAAKSGNPRTQAEQLNSQAVVAFKLQDFYKAIELFTEAICLCLFPFVYFALKNRSNSFGCRSGSLLHKSWSGLFQSKKLHTRISRF